MLINGENLSFLFLNKHSFRKKYPDRLVFRSVIFRKEIEDSVLPGSTDFAKTVFNGEWFEFIIRFIWTVYSKSEINSSLHIIFSQFFSFLPLYLYITGISTIFQSYYYYGF